MGLALLLERKGQQRVGYWPRFRDDKNYTYILIFYVYIKYNIIHIYIHRILYIKYILFCTRQEFYIMIPL